MNPRSGCSKFPFQSFLILLILLSSNFCAKSQVTITGISPSSGSAGSTITAVISGMNTNFMGGCGGGASYMDLYRNSCDRIGGYPLVPIDNEHIRVTYHIPSNAVNGHYALSYMTNYSQGIIQNAFQVINGTSPSVDSISPNNLTEATSTDISIHGTDLLAFLQANPHSITFTNTPFWQHEIRANFLSFPDSNTILAHLDLSGLVDSGYYSISIDPSVSGCPFGLINAIHVSGSYPKQITDVSPDTGYGGTTLSAVLTTQNMFLLSGSSSAPMYMELRGHAGDVIQNTIYGVIDDDHIGVSFDIPSTVNNGIYDMYFNSGTGLELIYPDAVNIVQATNRSITSFSPSTISAGTNVSCHIQGSAIDEIFGTAPVTVLLINSGIYTIIPASITNITPTAVDLGLNLAPYEHNGIYDLSVISGIGHYYFPNATEVIGGQFRGIVSHSPDTVSKGQIYQAIISGAYTSFMDSSGVSNVQSIHLVSTSTGYLIPAITQSQIQPIDSNHVSYILSIPLTAPRENYKATVTMKNGEIFTLDTAFYLGKYSVSGKVYYDADSNGVYNVWDSYLANKQVRLLPDNKIITTQNNGSFEFGVDPGSYQVEILPDSALAISTLPNPIQVTVTTNDISNLSIGLKNSGIGPRLAVSLSSDFLRCYNSSSECITVSNTGSTYSSGKVYYFIDTSRTSITSYNPQIGYRSSDTLVWYYYNLAPGTSKDFHVYFDVTGNPGEFVFTKAAANQKDSSQTVVYYIEDSLSDLIVCSYISNDKSVFPPGQQIQHNVLNTAFLEYQIRFLNTGTDTAQVVNIIDTLSPYLDVTTFQIVSSSNTVFPQINGNVVSFIFPNINLPDSATNPLSSGYVRFRIKPLASAPLGSVINNTAGIQFNFDSALYTNNVYSTLRNHLIGIEEITGQDKLTIFPNPAHSAVRILSGWNNTTKESISIYNFEGKLIYNKTLISNLSEISILGFPPGLYSVILRDLETGKVISGKLVIE